MGLNNLGLGFLFTAKDVASGVMANLKGNLNELGEKGEEITKSLKERFEQFASGLGVMGLGLEGLVQLGEKAGVAAEFGNAIKLATNRVSEAEFPMEQMTALVDELGHQFGVLPVDEVNALTAAIGAGARDAAKAQALLTASNQLAIATGTDLKANLSAVSGVLRAFNLDLKDSVVMGDRMFAASKHVEGGLEGMQTMLSILAPTAHQANMTSTELLASIAQMSAAGIAGRHGMMGLRAIIDSMIKPSDDARQEAARLGIAWDAATIQGEGLPMVLAQITASGKMNTHTLEKLFGSTEAATVAMGLMRDGGGQLKAMMNEVANSTGAASEAAEKMVKQSKRFEAYRETLDTMIGESLLPAKTAFYKFGISILQSLTEANPALIHFFTLLAFGASLLTVVVGAGMVIAAAWPIISAAFGIVAASVMESAVAILAAVWPIALIAAAVGLAIWGLKVAFDNNFGGMADTVRVAWDDIKLAFNALVELFSGGGFTEDTWQKLEKHSGIRDFALSVFGWVSRIENFFSHIGSSFEHALGRDKGIFEAIGQAISAIVDAFAMLSGGVDGAADAFDTFGSAGDAVGNVLWVVFEVLMMAFQVVAGVVHAAVSLVVGAVGVIKSTFSGLIDIFYGLTEFILEIFQGHWGKAWHGMKMIVFGVVDAIIGVVLSLVGIIAGAVDSIAGMFGKKLHLQKMFEDFRDSTHNQMAKDFGVADGTGIRTIRSESDSGVGGVAVGGRPEPVPASGVAGPLEDEPVATPANASPWGGISGGPEGWPKPGAGNAAGTPPAEAPDFSTMTSHLEQIAKNTEGGGPPMQINVLLDGDVIGKAVARGKANDTTRGFTPAPVPGA